MLLLEHIVDTRLNYLKEIQEVLPGEPAVLAWLLKVRVMRHHIVCFVGIYVIISCA